jgi:hypothetical protein
MVRASVLTAVNVGSLYWNRYVFIQVVAQLCSLGWVEPVPDPPLLKNLVALRIEPGTSRSVSRNSDHYTTQAVIIIIIIIIWLPIIRMIIVEHAILGKPVPVSV